MSLSNTLQNMKIPDVAAILKSSKAAKTTIDNVDTNIVHVNFFYANNKLKTSVTGEILHITDIPICVIDYPSKLAYLLLDESMVYDLKNKCFEIYVNEKYTHALEVNLHDDKVGDIQKLIIPKLANKFEYRLVEMQPPIHAKDQSKILLTASMLKSLGRGKLLELTQDQNNDGMVIVGLLAGAIGMVLGFIISLALVSGGS